MSYRRIQAFNAPRLGAFSNLTCGVHPYSPTEQGCLNRQRLQTEADLGSFAINWYDSLPQLSLPFNRPTRFWRRE